MRTEFLAFSPPWIGEEEISEVVKALRSDWLSTGPRVKSFEEEFKRHFDAPSALALNSCTAGMHIALVTMGIGPGDEVLVPSLTFAATANVVEHVGATPVFVDVEPDTLNICPKAVAQAIGPRTKAIMVVHYAGHPADMDALQALADGHGLAIIEDAAHASMAKYKGRWVGSSNNPTAFSFYATKNLTTGEGGMLTAPPEFIDKAKVLALHGMSRDAWGRYGKNGTWFYEIVQPGFKYNMTDMQAALGLVQLRKADEIQRRREALAAFYHQALASVPGLTLPVARPEVTHAWHLYPIRVDASVCALSRDELIPALKERNIGTSVHFIPLHIQPFYRDKYGLKPESFPVAQHAFEGLLSLPLNPRMSLEDAQDVVDALVDLVRR